MNIRNVIATTSLLIFSVAHADDSVFKRVFGDKGPDHILVKQTVDKNGQEAFSFQECSDLNDRNCKPLTVQGTYGKSQLQKKYTDCLNSAKTDYAMNMLLSLPLGATSLIAAGALVVGASTGAFVTPVMARVEAACYSVMTAGLGATYGAAQNRGDHSMKMANSLKTFAKQNNCSDMRLDMPIKDYKYKLEQVLREGCPDMNGGGAQDRSH